MIFSDPIDLNIIIMHTVLDPFLYLEILINLKKDRKWPKIGRGKRARLVVIQRKHYFQIISARLAKEDGLEIKSSFAIAKIGEKGLLKSCKNVLRNEI